MGRLTAFIALALLLLVPLASPAAPLPDLTVSSNLGAPLSLSPSCAQGQKAIVFHLIVSNLGKGPSPVLNNVHAVWVQDTSSPAWAGGAPLTVAIPAHGTQAVDVALLALSPASTMAGAHTFKVTVNGAKTIVETSFANNTATIPATIPKGFCVPTVSLAPGPGTNLNPAKPGYNSTVMAPGANLPTPTPTMPPPVNLAQAFTKDLCQQHGGSAGSLACYIGLPAGKLALVWDYPFSNQVDGYRVYTADNAPSGPMSVSMSIALKPVATMTDGSWKFAVLDPPRAGSCFAVTAYKGSLESARSQRFCVGVVAKMASLTPDITGSMVEDWFYDPHTEVWKQSNEQPNLRDLLYLVVGYSHDAITWRDQAHTDVALYQNSLIRGYVHFNAGVLSGHTITQARLHLVAAGGGMTCLANWGGSNRIWSSSSPHVARTSGGGGSPIQGPDLRLDVTPLVQSWANSPGSNYGIVLDSEQPEVIYNMIILSSSCTTQFSSATLEVTYY